MNAEFEGRPLETQLSTARYLLAQFIAQIEEYEAMTSEERRTPHGRDLGKRIAGLREGRAKWQARAKELVAEIERQDSGN